MQSQDYLDQGGTDAQDELTLQAQRENSRKTAERDIEWLMSSPRGRRIVWWLLDIAGVSRTSYPCDANMAFREGGRNIGLQLQARVIDCCPDAYIAMLNEQKVRSTHA